jgi:hypothetical protein
MRTLRGLERLTFLIAFGLLITISAWCLEPSAPDKSTDAGSTIAPGTVITMANWQQYRAFMPDGMAALFEGKYFWKIPADVRMEVGPTIIHPLPTNYLEATKKNAQGVRVVELPDGGLSLANYHGGIPFPDPSEPHKGWKTLANAEMGKVASSRRRCPGYQEDSLESQRILLRRTYHVCR